MRPAIFFDRDGTLIEQVHHLVDPDDVRLISGAADAIARLRDCGYLCVVVTNQSVIGRGMLTVDGLEQVHLRMHQQLAERGAALDGVYFCPIPPKNGASTEIEHIDRKPGPGMLWRAARDMDIDLSRSWMIGDMPSDMYAGFNAGCKGSVLVLTGHGHTACPRDPIVSFVADDVLAASQLITEIDSLEPVAQGSSL